MIIRILVVDPAPRNALEDLIVYQVPENSRAHELLEQLLSDAGLEHEAITSIRTKRRKPHGPRKT